MRGIHRSPVNSPHKEQVTRKIFPFDDVILTMQQTGSSSCSDNTPCNVTQFHCRCGQGGVLFLCILGRGAGPSQLQRPMEVMETYPQLTYRPTKKTLPGRLRGRAPRNISGWHYDMKTLSTLLALFKENPPVTNGFPSYKGPVMRSFD